MATKKKGVMKKAASKKKAAPPAGHESAAVQAQDKPDPMDFFPGQRVPVKLVGWSPRHKAPFRLHLELSIPLSGLVSLPDHIGSAFESVAAIEHGVFESKVEGVPDPQTIRIFAAPTSHSTAATWPAATLNNLVVQRPKRQAKNRDVGSVELRFNTEVKASDEHLLWAKAHHGKSFWGEFVVTQAQLSKEADEKRKVNGESKQTSFNPDQLSQPSGKDAAAGADQ